MMTMEFKNEIAQAILNLLSDFRIIFDDGREEIITNVGVPEYDRRVKSYVDGDTVKIMARLDDDVVGNITEVQVRMTDGRVALAKGYEIQKTNYHGFILAFAIQLVEVERSNL